MITKNNTGTSKQYALKFINSINIHEQKLFIDELSLNQKIKIKSVTLVDKNADVSVKKYTPLDPWFQQNQEPLRHNHVIISLNEIPF